MEALITQHLERSPDVRGGRARIAGRRITVDDVVIMHRNMGHPLEEVAAELDLSLAQVHAAMTYYYDNQDEIEALIARDDAIVEESKKRHPSLLRQKLRSAQDG